MAAEETALLFGLLGAATNLIGPAGARGTAQSLIGAAGQTIVGFQRAKHARGRTAPAAPIPTDTGMTATASAQLAASQDKIFGIPKMIAFVGAAAVALVVALFAFKIGK